MPARSCAAAVAVGGKATERFMLRRGDKGVAWGPASAGLGVKTGLAAGECLVRAAVASEVGSRVGDAVTAAAVREGWEGWTASGVGDVRGGGGCEAPGGVARTGDTFPAGFVAGVASAGVGAAGAAVASAVEVGTGSEAASGVGSATGAASAGKDGEVTAEAAGEVGADLTSGVGKGKGTGRPVDAAAAGDTNPGESVTSLF